MRKQTKVVAVTSAAALLAIGASMTSFAATGWVQENGEWFWYDRDGSRVEDEWKKSGNDWYWLDSDENGAMALDKLIEDDGDTYYVNSTGAMIRNAWVSIVNEDQDDDDPAEYHWYYFQSNGKAYKKGDGSTTRFRTINGKRYAFDDDGKMLYGWVNAVGERETDDDGWETADYYLGDWNDGSMKTGWQKITVYDDSSDKEDDMDYWFNFQSNGKKRADKDEWKSNGKAYSFDGRGVMIYEWATTTTVPSIASAASTSVNGGSASTSNWRYYGSPEDGARKTKGWFKVIAPENDNDNTFLNYTTDTFASTHADDESEKWYYANGDGQLYEGVIESIKGKYYGFWPEYNAIKGASSGKGGAMLTGLCVLEIDPTSDKILSVIAENIDSSDLDDILDNTYTNSDIPNLGAPTSWASRDIYLYYFGNDEDSDGVMKTGNVNINLDGTSYTFLFKKTGNVTGGRGRGVSGIDDNKYIYSHGCRVKADSDDRYQLVRVWNTNAGGNLDINSDGVSVVKRDAPQWDSSGTSYRNSEKETVRYHYGNTAGDGINFTTNGITNNGYYLVNTSGNVQRNKNGVKDGNDCYYYVNSNRNVILYTDTKTLRADQDGPYASAVTSNEAKDFINGFLGGNMQ